MKSARIGRNAMLLVGMIVGSFIGMGILSFFMWLNGYTRP